MTAVLDPSPATAPGRARRVGAVPVPRVRPLAEVLPAPRPAAVPDTVAPDPAVARAQDELDRLAAALRPVAARLLAVVADVLAGRRPPGHLAELATPGVATTLARAAPTVRPVRPRAVPAPGTTPGTATGLRGLRVCAVGPRAAEVAAVVHGRDRVRALAARLERVDDGPADPGRWRVTALCPG
ncbi:hypothetical protein GCM10023200_19830 [Actinomycetospora chlora]|uniref:Uncharacterized protein n=1 Tax=Actinomycetospora chlora TaxID=663608 RepID=A0ABP9AUM9_9PSEU